MLVARCVQAVILIHILPEKDEDEQVDEEKLKPKQKKPKMLPGSTSKMVCWLPASALASMSHARPA